jgi:hypothetical protein
VIFDPTVKLDGEPWTCAPVHLFGEVEKLVQPTANRDASSPIEEESITSMHESINSINLQVRDQRFIVHAKG